MQVVFPTPAKPDCAVRALRVEIEDNESDSDLSGSEREGEPRCIFVAATSDRTKMFGDQGTDPHEKRLDSMEVASR